MYNKVEMSKKPSRHRFFTSALILRLVFSTLLFLFVFILALNSVLGYQVNLGSAEFTPTGIIQINTTPNNANVSINNQSLPFLSNNRLSVSDGNYLVSASRKDYHDWKSILPVQLKTVWWAEARLVPKVKKIAALKVYPHLIASYASPDRRWFLNHLGVNRFELLDLKDEKPLHQLIDFNKILPPEYQSLDLRFFDWNLASNSLLFQAATHPSKITFSLSLGEVSSAGLNNLSAKFPGLIFDQIKIASGDGKTCFVLSKQSLYRLNLDQTDSLEKIADQVVDYKVLNFNQSFFLQTGVNDKEPKLLKLYDHNKKTSLVFRSLAHDAKILFDVFENKYDGYSYLALSEGHKFFVWRSDFNQINWPNGIIDSIDYFKKFKQNNPDLREYFALYNETLPFNLSVAGDGRFVVLDFATKALSDTEYQNLLQQMTALKNTKNIVPPDKKNLNIYRRSLVFDTNYRLKFNLNVTHPVGSVGLAEGSQAITWLNNNIIWENLFGVVRIKDYNGQNQHKLVPASPIYDVQLSPSGKYFYFWQTVNGQAILKRLQMIL